MGTSGNKNNHFLSHKSYLSGLVWNATLLKPLRTALITTVSLFLYYLFNIYYVSGTVMFSNNVCYSTIC